MRHQDRDLGILTSIQGVLMPWPRHVWQLWYTYADLADPKLQGRPVSRANYYEPTAGTDRVLDRGIARAGFAFWAGHRLYIVEV